MGIAYTGGSFTWPLRGAPEQSLRGCIAAHGIIVCRRRPTADSQHRLVGLSRHLAALPLTAGYVRLSCPPLQIPGPDTYMGLRCEYGAGISTADRSTIHCILLLTTVVRLVSPA